MKDERERELDLGCKKVKLSIIIPIYNMEAYLKRCLDSVKAAVEKLSDVVEVLLINDGSTDSSEKIALEYCEVCKYMHLYNNCLLYTSDRDKGEDGRASWHGGC